MKVVRGNPTAEELAAVVIVLRRRKPVPPEPPTEIPAWRRGVRDPWRTP